MRVGLFGGNGYLGHALQQMLQLEGYEPHVIGRDDAPYPPPDLFVNLACPRNKPGAWNFRRAEAALDHALWLTTTMKGGTCLQISSLSVDDVPDNEYAMFKRMAELVVSRQNWCIVRLPTMLGSAGGVYRADLGLHQVATALARGEPAWINASIVRHVMPVMAVAKRIVDGIHGGDWCCLPEEITHGAVSFADVVPPSVRLVDMVSGHGYVAGAKRAYPGYVADLRAVFDRLVQDIKEGKVRGI